MTGLRHSPYRRQRDLPRLLPPPPTPLPPPGPDYSIRLIQRLNALAKRLPGTGAAPLLPPPQAARAALEGELQAVRQTLQWFANK